MQNNKTISLVFTTILVFLFTYFPALELLFNKWSNSEDYAHSFLIVPIVIYMIWQKYDFFDQYKRQNYAGAGLVVVAILSYVCALQTEVPTAIFVATFLTIVSILVYLGGVSVLRELTIPILLLFMIIPIPNQLYSMVTFPLQLKISQVNEFLIQLIGVPIYREGNVLNVPGKSFQVVEACSGMRSLISLSTLSLVVGHFMLQKSRLKCCLFALSFPIAFLVNVVRVMVLVVAFHYFKFDLSGGTEHTITGMVIFMFGLMLLYGLQRVLEFWDT